VLLGDPDPFARAGLGAVLGGYDDIEIVGEVASAGPLLAVCHGRRPNVLLLDIGLPGLRPAPLVEQLGDCAGNNGGASAILLMTPGFDADVLAAVRAGVAGALIKTTSPDGYANALRVVTEDSVLLHPPRARHLLDPAAAVARPTDGPEKSLTEREWEVATLLAEGLSNREIAHRLHVAESTVKYHVSQLLRKLGARDRLQVAAFVHRRR
jgi:DNA-binding NarL/FixJ family response regulator